MRYLASISYDGSNFYGFERQPRKRTIQGELEKVLTKIDKHKVEIKGAGRTDRYVHAYDQHIHFDLKQNIPVKNIKLAMNAYLPSDIRCNSVIAVSDDFHARHDCIQKEYRYYINVGKYDVMKDKYLYNYNSELNIKKMKEATKHLLGKHSYKAFCSGERENYNSTIDKITISKKGNILEFIFVGKSFYRYMVRNMMGLLLLVGQERVEPIMVKEILDKGDENHKYKTAPACGLYLYKVKYDLSK